MNTIAYQPEEENASLSADRQSESAVAASEQKTGEPRIFDLIAVGNIKVDIFLSFYHDSSKWRTTPRTKELAFKLGEKVSVDKTDYGMGGNANNVTVGLSRLGYNVALMAELGDDAFADDLEKNLRAEGVSRELLTRTPGSRTSLGVVMNVEDDRTILSQHVARSHPFDFTGLATRLVYITSIGYAWEHVYQKALDFALENKVPIAFNPGTVQLREQPEVFWKVMKHSHILCVNKEEALKILQGGHSRVVASVEAKKYKDAEAEMSAIMSALAELGPKIVVITDGGRGSYARAEDGRTFHQDVIPTMLVERTGTGDAFLTGLLGAALSGKSLPEAMLWGTRNAAAVVSKVGAQAGLLTREQMESNIMDMRLIDLGYSKPLFVLPFDHRDAFARYLFEIDMAALTEGQMKQIKEFKAMIYEAVKRSMELGVPRGAEGILTDEETGAEVLHEAEDDESTTILSVEKDGSREFELEYGTQFHQHIEKFKPTFVKAKIYYNITDSEESRVTQQERLKEIIDYSHERGYKFLLAVRIEPTDEQIEQAGGARDDYERVLKSEVMVKVINELQLAGVEPDVWWLEGVEKSEDFKKVLKAIQVNGRDKVGLVIWGRGADLSRIEHWLKVGAGMPGVLGFAVGRTVFWEAILEYYHKKLSRDEAINLIAERFANLYKLYNEQAIELHSQLLPGAEDPIEPQESEDEGKGEVKIDQVKEDDGVAKEREEEQEEEKEEAQVLEVPSEGEDEDVEARLAEIEHDFKTTMVGDQALVEDEADHEMGVDVADDDGQKKGQMEEAEEAAKAPVEPDSVGSDDDEGMPAWAVQRKPVEAESGVREGGEEDDWGVGAISVGGDDDNKKKGSGWDGKVEGKNENLEIESEMPLKRVVGGFAVDEPSFEVPEEDEGGRKGVWGKLFGKK